MLRTLAKRGSTSEREQPASDSDIDLFSKLALAFTDLGAETRSSRDNPFELGLYCIAVTRVSADTKLGLSRGGGGTLEVSRQQQGLLDVMIELTKRGVTVLVGEVFAKFLERLIDDPNEEISLKITKATPITAKADRENSYKETTYFDMKPATLYQAGFEVVIPHELELEDALGWWDKIEVHGEQAFVKFIAGFDPEHNLAQLCQDTPGFEAIVNGGLPFYSRAGQVMQRYLKKYYGIESSLIPWSFVRDGDPFQTRVVSIQTSTQYGRKNRATEILNEITMEEVHAATVCVFNPPERLVVKSHFGFRVFKLLDREHRVVGIDTYHLKIISDPEGRLQGLINEYPILEKVLPNNSLSLSAISQIKKLIVTEGIVDYEVVPNDRKDENQTGLFSLEINYGPKDFFEELIRNERDFKEILSGELPLTKSAADRIISIVKEINPLAGLRKVPFETNYYGGPKHGQSKDAAYYLDLMILNNNGKPFVV